MGQCNYLNDLGLLQRLVFMLVLLSWCFWFMCVCLYIPYILLYSPQEPGPPPDTRIRPAKDFYSGQVSAVVITCALFVDSLMASALYKRYKVRRELFYPWLVFYAALVVALLVLSGLLATVPADPGQRVWAAAPAAIAAFYCVVYAHAVLLFLRGGRRSANVLGQMRDVYLEPLAEVMAEEADKMQKQRNP